LWSSNSYFCSTLSIWPKHYRSHWTVSYLLWINCKFDPSIFKSNNKCPSMKFYFKATTREKYKCQCRNHWAVTYKDTTCFYLLLINKIWACVVCHTVIHRWRMQIYLQTNTNNTSHKVIPLFYHAVSAIELWSTAWNKEGSFWIRRYGNVLFQYEVSKSNVSKNVGNRVKYSKIKTALPLLTESIFTCIICTLCNQKCMSEICYI
jgi:hypothetical protein